MLLLYYSNYYHLSTKLAKHAFHIALHFWMKKMNKILPIYCHNHEQIKINIKIFKKIVLEENRIKRVNLMYQKQNQTSITYNITISVRCGQKLYHFTIKITFILLYHICITIKNTCYFFLNVNVYVA